MVSKRRNPPSVAGKSPTKQAIELSHLFVGERDRAHAEEREAIQLLDGVKGLTVTDGESCASVVEFTRGVCSKRDELEAARKSATTPLNQVLRTINSWFKPALDTLGATEQHLKKLVADYQLARAAEQRSQFAAAQAAMVAGNTPAATIALVAASSAAPEQLDGASVREQWVAEIVNAELLPREWLIPDEALIQKHARETAPTEEPFPIPGVRFVKRGIVTVRR